MTEEQRLVRDFHERFGLPSNRRPIWPGEVTHRSRVMAIEEELAEFRNAGDTRSLVEIADALADLLYSIYSAAETYGIDLQPVFAELHRANMSKAGPTRKGEDYQPPKVRECLEHQMQHPAA